MKNMDRRLEAIEQTQKEIWSKLNRLQVNLTAIKAQWSLIGLIAAIVIDVLLRLWKP